MVTIVGATFLCIFSTFVNSIISVDKCINVVAVSIDTFGCVLQCMMGYVVLMFDQETKSRM